MKYLIGLMQFSPQLLQNLNYKLIFSLHLNLLNYKLQNLNKLETTQTLPVVLASVLIECQILVLSKLAVLTY